LKGFITQAGSGANSQSVDILTILISQHGLPPMLELINMP